MYKSSSQAIISFNIEIIIIVRFDRSIDQKGLFPPRDQ